MPASLLPADSNSFRCVPGSGISRLDSNSILNVFKTLHSDFCRGWTDFHPASSKQIPLVPAWLSASLGWCFLDDSYFDWGEIEFLFSFLVALLWWLKRLNIFFSYSYWRTVLHLTHLFKHIWSFIDWIICSLSIHSFLKKYLALSVCTCVCMCTHACAQVLQCVWGGQRTVCWSWFSSSTLQVPGIKVSLA